MQRLARGVSQKTDECTGTGRRSRQGPTYLIAGQPHPREILRSCALVPSSVIQNPQSLT